jgi:acyl-CoA thioesterase
LDEVLTEELRERLAASAFHSWVGARVTSAERGEVTVELQASSEHLNLQGLIHGGLLATLADIAMGLSVRTSVEPGRRHVTIEMSIRFLRPGKPGKIKAQGHALRVGRQVAFAEAQVTGENGRVLATAQGTYSVTGSEG